MADDAWEADRFEDGSTKLVGEQQVEHMEAFAQNFAQELLALEDVLDTLMTVRPPPSSLRRVQRRSPFPSTSRSVACCAILALPLRLSSF
jgi:hypothetical protein